MTDTVYTTALRWISVTAYTLALIVAILLIFRYVGTWN